MLVDDFVGDGDFFCLVEAGNFLIHPFTPPTYRTSFLISFARSLSSGGRSSIVFESASSTSFKAWAALEIFSNGCFIGIGNQDEGGRQRIAGFRCVGAGCSVSERLQDFFSIRKSLKSGGHKL